MVGSDATNTPPAHALAHRGIVRNVHGYMLYGDYRHPHPPSAIIDAAENGAIDVAVVWGPMAGYFAALEPSPLTVEPVQPWQDGAGLPMAFDISMGVRRGDYALLQRLNDSLARNQAAIAAILAAYHVPVLPEPFAVPESAPSQAGKRSTHSPVSRMKAARLRAVMVKSSQS
jgi:mxaJ protein